MTIDKIEVLFISAFSATKVLIFRGDGVKWGVILLGDTDIFVDLVKHLKKSTTHKKELSGLFNLFGSDVYESES